MTEKEAIELLKRRKVLSWQGGFGNYDEAEQMAIKALEEIQAYRAYKNIFESHFSKDALELLSDKKEFGKWLERGRWIAKRCDEINRELEQYRALGTVEELRVARDKQVAKKVVFVHPLQLDDGGDYMCPSCETGTVYDAYGQQSHYCHYCGQKLDWSDEDD